MSSLYFVLQRFVLEKDFPPLPEKESLSLFQKMTNDRKSCDIDENAPRDPQGAEKDQMYSFLKLVTGDLWTPP